MKKIELILWGAGFFVLPFIFSTSSFFEQMREPKAHFLVLLAGLAISIKLMEKVSVPIGIGAALCYISAFFVSPFFPESAILTLTAALVSCFTVAHARKHHVERGLEIFEISACICAAYAMLIQFKGIDPLFTMIPGHDFRRVFVFFGQHTLYGPFCVAAMASALFNHRFYRAFLLAVPIPFIDASFTYLSFSVVVGFFLVFRFGKVAFFSIAILGLVLSSLYAVSVKRQDYVKIEPLNDNGRFPLWRLTYRIARARPFVGHGFGAFPNQFPAFQSKDIRQQNGLIDENFSEETKKLFQDGDELRKRSGFFVSPHNEILNAFYELGILGVLMCLWIMGLFAVYFYFGPKQNTDWALAAIFFSFCANSMGNFALHLIPQALIPLWAFVAVTRRALRSNLNL